MGVIASKELLAAQSEVQVLASRLRQSENVIATVRKQLVVAEQVGSVSASAKADAEARAAAEATALREAREKLEMMSGAVKVAEAERAAVRRLKGELEGARATAAADAREKERLNAEIIAEANRRLAPTEHPIFGTLVSDLGFKQVYRSSPLTVWAATPIWEKQRAFRADRAAGIAKAKSAAKVPGWPGTISICELDDSSAPPAEGSGGSGGCVASACVVIDGQHRLGAAHMLAEQQGGRLSDSLRSITVELYPKVSSAMAQALFTEINKVQPVKLVDLPGGAGASERDNAILTGAVEELKTMYGEMFRPSPNCRAPHVNVDTLRDELYTARAVSRIGAQSASQLLAWLLRENERLRVRKAEEWGGKVNAKALAKAADNRFFLGMDTNWIREGALREGAGDEQAEDDIGADDEK